jgi:hypothetical protein
VVLTVCMDSVCSVVVTGCGLTRLGVSHYGNAIKSDYFKKSVIQFDRPLILRLAVIVQITWQYNSLPSHLYLNRFKFGRGAAKSLRREGVWKILEIVSRKCLILISYTTS